MINLGEGIQAEWNGGQGSGRIYIPFNFNLVFSYAFISSAGNDRGSSGHTKEKDMCLVQPNRNDDRYVTEMQGKKVSK